MKPTTITTKDILTVQEVANLLKVSDDTIYAMVDENKLPHRRVGRQIRFPGWLIIDWLNDGKIEGQVSA